MQRKRVTFLGVFGAGNLGNECTLQASIEQTRAQWPDAVLTCISTFPDDTRARHNIPAFPMEAPDDMRKAGACRLSLPRRLVRLALRRLPREVAHTTRGLRVAMASDVLIITGTQIVSDYLTGPFGWPYNIFKWSLLAACCRAKVLFLASGVGPIYHPLSRWLIKTSLGLASYRSYRDRASREYLEKIGFSTRGDDVFPDLAFGLSRRPSAPADTARRRMVIGVGIKDYKGARHGAAADAHAAYLATMVEFVSWLRERGYGVRLLIGDVRYDTDVRQDLIGRICGSTADAGDIVSEPAPTVDELMRQLADTDAVVSPRFHNLVLAMLLNKPVLALSDHPKLDSLMAGLDLDRYCLQLHELTTDDLRQTFLQLESEAEKMRVHVRKKVAEYQAALRQQFACALARARG